MAELERTLPIDEVVAAYFTMWNETDVERRRAVIAATWTDEAVYVDPQFAADGHEGLEAMVAAVHAQYPGYRFRLAGAIDLHHDRARWGWEFAGPDSSPPVATGVDFAVLAADGRLQQVTGFFTQAAAAA